MADREHVELVQRQIEALGVGVYLAEHDPHPGTSIAERVERALHASDAVVVLITTNSVDSAYVQQEVGLARAYRKPIVPLVDKHVDKTKLGLLTEVEWLEIDLEHPAEAFARVAQSLQPMIVSQARSDVVAKPEPARVGMSMSGADALILIGLGLVLGLLITQYNFKIEIGPA